MASSRRTTGTRKRKRKRNSTKYSRTTKPQGCTRSGLRDVLNHFADALAVLETIARALDAAEGGLGAGGDWRRDIGAPPRPSAPSEMFTTNSIC
jgi:hypothetical protein